MQLSTNGKQNYQTIALVSHYSHYASRILPTDWLHAILTHSILFAATTHFLQETHDYLARRNASQSPSNAIIIIKISIMNQFGLPLLHWKKNLWCAAFEHRAYSTAQRTHTHTDRHTSIWIRYRCDSVDALRRRRRRLRTSGCTIRLLNLLVFFSLHFFPPHSAMCNINVWHKQLAEQRTRRYKFIQLLLTLPLPFWTYQSVIWIKLNCTFSFFSWKAILWVNFAL